MHVLKSAEILGFRGQSKPIRLKFHRHANFIIGRNGTGKTTLINLLNSALALDHQALRQIPWTKILFKFREDGSNIVPSIEINRSSLSRGAVISFSYKASSTAEAMTFNFPARERSLVRGSSGQIMPIGARLRQAERGLNEQIGELYRRTWLSLARVDDPVSEDPWAETSNTPDVERRLTQSFTSLVGYFSRLDGYVADETRDFQKFWFLSFLQPATDSDTEILKRIDLNKEEETLRSIFQKFDMLPDTFEFRLGEYFQKLRKIVSRKDQIYHGWAEIGTVYDAIRLHALVEKWQELQEAQLSTYRPKTQFVSLATELLFNKRITVDRSNQTRIQNLAGENIPVASLSSGEKQLLIFLSETLLQEESPHLFLADEPELSLHVEWQEELVPSLLKLNSSAQVIFATHSPDIVGPFQDYVFQMEDLI